MYQFLGATSAESSRLDHRRIWPSVLWPAVPVPHARARRPWWITGLIVLIGLGGLALVQTTSFSRAPSPRFSNARLAEQRALMARDGHGLLTVPMRVREAVQMRIGHDERAFWGRREGSSVAFTNAAQGLHATLAPGGQLAIGDATTHVHFDSISVGRGPVLAGAELSGSTVSHNTATAGGHDIRESLINGPYGAEQTFVLARRPAGTGRLLLSERTGGVAARLTGNGQTVVFGTGSHALSYGSLAVIDARGRRLPARFVLSGHRLTIRIDDARARYPLTVDPTVTTLTPTATLTGPTASGAHFGFSVAATSSEIVVGAWEADQVYVFPEPASGVWATSGSAIVLNDPNLIPGVSQFGWSVAVSGSAIVVGDPQAFDNNYNGGNTQGDNGQAFVYANPTNPVLTATLSEASPTDAGDSGTIGDAFGTAVSVTGATVLVGAPHYNIPGTYETGAAYVFTSPSGTTTAAAQLLSPDADYSATFGDAVAISGTTAVVADPFGGPQESGEVFEFTMPTTGGWATTSSPSAAFTPPGAEQGDYFGLSVATDGTQIAVGEPENYPGQPTSAAVGTGAAFVYTEEGSWSSLQTATLTPPTGSTDEFGAAVALSGTAAVVGAPGYNTSYGGAFVYSPPGGVFGSGSLTASESLQASSPSSSPAYGSAVAFAGASVAASFQSSAGAVDVTQPTVTSSSVSPVEGSIVNGSGSTYTGSPTFTASALISCTPAYPCSWSSTPALPPGLTLTPTASNYGQTATVTGTPTAVDEVITSAISVSQFGSGQAAYTTPLYFPVVETLSTGIGSGPTGMATDPTDGVVLVAASRSNQIDRITPSSTAAVVTAGGVQALGFSDGGLNFPVDLAYSSSDDDLFVSDFGSSSAAQLASPLTAAGSADPLTGCSQQEGIAQASGGASEDVFVGCFGQGKTGSVAVMSPSGADLNSFVLAAAGSTAPSGVAPDGTSGDVAIADAAGNKLYTANAGGVVGSVALPTGATPANVAYADVGGTSFDYVADPGTGQISVVKVATDSSPQDVANISLPAIGKTPQPYGIATNGSNVLIVSDSANSSAAVYTLSNTSGYAQLDYVVRVPYPSALTSAPVPDGVADMTVDGTNLAFIGDETGNAVTVVDPPLPDASDTSDPGTDPGAAPISDGDPVSPVVLGAPSSTDSPTVASPAVSLAQGSLLNPIPIRTATKRKPTVKHKAKRHRHKHKRRHTRPHHRRTI